MTDEKKLAQTSRVFVICKKTGAIKSSQSYWDEESKKKAVADLTKEFELEIREIEFDFRERDYDFEPLPDLPKEGEKGD